MSVEEIMYNLPPETPLSTSLADNLRNLADFTGGSTDIMKKTARVGCCDIVVLTCEGMAASATTAALIYDKLNHVGNKEQLSPDDLLYNLFNVYLTAADQCELTTIGDLCKRLQSGFAVILVEGACKAIGIGVQGYKSRGVDEPSTENNVRGSREGFTEVIRTNMGMIRRRVKSPTLVFEMSQLGERSNTDICLCYFSDKADKKLVDNVKKRLKSVSLNTILESGYIQPWLEGKGGWLFSECGTVERPDTLIAKLYEGRVAVLVDGTPVALVVPTLFVESFQTLDDYTQKPFYAAFLRLVRLSAYFITLFLPGAYVAVASFTPEMLPSSLLLNLAAAEQTAPFSLMIECLFIHFLYEILREAGIRLPRPIGHAIGVVGGIVIGDITVNAGLVGAPMVLVVALSGLCSFVVPSMYERTVLLRFFYIIAGGTLGLVGLLLAAGIVIVKMCSIDTYGVPYLAPISPFTPAASRDMVVRSDWTKLGRKDVGVSGLNGSDGL